jgi:hypothetical protein
MSERQTTSADFSTTAVFDAEFTGYLVELLRCKKHIWVEEQQTGHRVCAWCNACETCPHGKSGRPNND